MVYRIFRLLPLLLALGLLGIGGYYVKTRFLDPPARGVAEASLFADEGLFGGNSGLVPQPKGSGVVAVPQITARLAEPDRRVIELPNFALEDYPNARARHDALTRIDAVPHLDAALRARLIAGVNQARGLGCIFVVPFEPGKNGLGPREADVLVNGFKSEGVRRLLEDRTLLFAVLGYGDVGGDEKSALARAQSVLAVMRGRCGVQGTAYAVGMDGPSPLGTKASAGNGLVEIWAGFP